MAMVNDPCAVFGDQQEADAVTQRYEYLIGLVTDQFLKTGDVDLWDRAMQKAIRMAYLQQAVAGTSSGREDLLGASDRARVEANIEAQYGYLDGFVADVRTALKDGASLDFVKARALLYAKAPESEYWRQATSHLDLPAMPRDGSTECLSNCQCSWDLECGNGEVRATWVLGQADHCPTCKQRAAEWNPLIISRAN